MAVLYRKYRPTKLEDVVGQEQITHTLAQSLKQQKLAHAYLFIGPRGTGKTSVARIFAHAVNGFDYQVEDNYLDIIEIDAASNTGVDNIRELREKAVIAPTKGRYKVYIIDEVHMLTKSASNALLKTLEEPPEHVIFIMATTDAHKVPITISSRTQVHTFKLADPETMQKHLRKIADAEQIKITDDALTIIVRRGGGSFRDSLSLLDQIANLSDGEITAEAITSALGLPEDQAIQSLLEAYAHADHTEIHHLLQELLNSGVKPEVIASELIAKIIANPESSLLSLLAKLPEVQPPFPEAKLLLAFLSSNSTQPTDQQQPIVQQQPASRQAPVQAKRTVPKPTNPTVPKPNPAPAPIKTKDKTEIEPEPSTTSAESVEATPTIPSTQPRGDFSWDDFVARVQEQNAAVSNQLEKVNYELTGDTLHLYPNHKFTKNILERPGNTQILVQQLGGYKLVIHELNEQKIPEDGQLSQISAIMGGVQEVKGDLPF